MARRPFCFNGDSLPGASDGITIVVVRRNEKRRFCEPPQNITQRRVAHMERTAGLGHLTPNEWERLQEMLDRFEKAWDNVGSGDAIDLKGYLPATEDPLRPVALQELIKAELEIRWRRGQTVRIESYLSDFPELQVVGTLSPLIYEEYRVRQLHGDKPPVTAYQDRFPNDYEEL
jgi:hypothetical protein